MSIEEARQLARDSMAAYGHTAEEAHTIADHLIDSELRGLEYGGLARCLSIVEHLRTAPARRPISVLRDSPASAHLDGGYQVGYLVAQRATDIAIEKAKQTGVAIVGASKTWYTGMFSYYLERVTQAGFVGMAAGSGAPLVAPHGGTQRRFSTNPIAFGFPSTNAPVIWDIGTSSIMMADVVLKDRLGERLQEGQAFDQDGGPTMDPAAALRGAIAVWGGHKGSGLAMSVQLLGMLAGQDNAAPRLTDCGFLLLVVDPQLFGSTQEFCEQVSTFAAELRATRPVDPAQPVRVPFERSIEIRRRRMDAGHIDVPDLVVQALQKAIAKADGA
ncbi:Ldh family oxidoreductase [Variovorax sp. dw_308]|nr:Ldh family oxidoreductase [Variovorax sp. dw_308]